MFFLLYVFFFQLLKISFLEVRGGLEEKEKVEKIIQNNSNYYELDCIDRLLGSKNL